MLIVNVSLCIKLWLFPATPRCKTLKSLNKMYPYLSIQCLLHTFLNSRRMIKVVDMHHNFYLVAVCKGLSL
uniref:Uncharacterized protein n=1 Tax=Rhizophora mucronata TaxID=61149 RepID=A0A2P2JWV8_RHIMU